MDDQDIKRSQGEFCKEGESQATHTPYSISTGEKPDFEVEYEFDIDPELEGIRPGQGMRCDFLYLGDDPERDGVHMIWPEFLDVTGDVITDKKVTPSYKGKANMWIGMPKMREMVHKHRIKIGTEGYWVVGSRVLAKVKVTKIIGMFENQK